MKVKLCEIFISLPGKSTYSARELSALDLQPDFICKIAARFDLSFMGNAAIDGNLCFAENKEVRPEYRRAFNKAEVLEIILPQILHPIVNLEQDEVLFPGNVHSFFSKSFKSLIAVKARKKYLRQTMLERRNNVPRKERAAFSQKINRQLWDLILEKNARVVHTYLTMGSEVNVLPLLQKALDNGVQIIAPKALKKRQMRNLVLTDLKNMEAGIFNTYHPKDTTEYRGEYDLIIVAGLAFDKKGFRVGYGGGYYDAFLTGQDAAMKVGVCYPFQIVDSVPVEAHDIQLNQVVS